MPPLLFWSFVASTVGVWGAQSFASLIAGSPALHAISDAALLSVVGLELLMAAVWVPILRRRGWSLDVVTTRASAADPLRGLTLYVINLLAYWVFYDLARLLAPGFVAATVESMRVRGTVSWGTVLVLTVVNPVVEEFVYLGFLANVLRRQGTSVALAASVLARVVVHVYQGPLGALSTVPYGLVLAGFYLDDRRLWPAVIAHGLADLAGLAAIVRAA
jgi:CAAX protease family protein